MLDQFKVSSLEEAQNFFDERQRLSQLLQGLQTKLNELDGTNTQLRYQELQNRVERLTREKERDSQTLQSLLAEQTLQLVDLQSNETWQTRLSSLEADQQNLSQSLSHARKRIGDCGDRLHELDNEIKDCDREIRTASEQMKLEEKNLGEPEQRESKLTTLKLRIEEQSGELKQLHAELNDIQPEHLERIIKRQSESIKNLDKQKEDAIGTRAGALSKLQSDGSVDIYAELAAAESAVQYAELQYEQRRQDAFAIKLLKELFEREQKKLTDSLTEPFVQRMKKYVQCFTGEVPKISFEVTNKGFNELRIARSSDNNTPIDFDQLSGGAREQIAAAARLAVAEVLASDSADGLPIVFDDAFSYSDSRRLESLPRMIEHAIDAGLQVIIVTCNPLQYAALGATTVQISR
jgi:DNA repair exonuclease SbcCD ATPase subunit